MFDFIVISSIIYHFTLDTGIMKSFKLLSIEHFAHTVWLIINFVTKQSFT